MKQNLLNWSFERKENRNKRIHIIILKLPRIRRVGEYSVLHTFSICKNSYTLDDYFGQNETSSSMATLEYMFGNEQI